MNNETFPPKRIEISSNNNGGKDVTLKDLFHEQSHVQLKLHKHLKAPGHVLNNSKSIKSTSKNFESKVPDINSFKTLEPTAHADLIDTYPRMVIEKMPQDNSCLFHAVG